MLSVNIANLEAFAQADSGNYEHVPDLQAFVTAGNSLKSLRTKLIGIKTDYVARVHADADAKVSVLPKGAEVATQFTPGASFLASLDAVITAVQNAEIAALAVDFPTA